MLKCPLHIVLTLDVITLFLATVFNNDVGVAMVNFVKKHDIFRFSATDEASNTAVAAMTPYKIVRALFFLLSTGLITVVTAYTMFFAKLTMFP